MSVGKALATARFRAGLTVAQVSKRTGIGRTIITDIEVDDFSACDGDTNVRGDIRSIAQAVGADPEPLVREYDMARLWVRISMDGTQPFLRIPSAEVATPTPEAIKAKRSRPWWITVLVLVWLGLAGYDVLGGTLHATSAASSAQSHPVPTSSSALQAGPGPSSPKTTTPSPAPGRMLIPASATAFEPYAGGQGDHSNLAGRAIDGSLATAWQTDWYSTARLGGLYPGTGLLVDMGQPVTITAVQVMLGPARGADFQLRIGDAPALADLRAVAHARSVVGHVHVRLTTPVRGRYVLIWFTSLPPNVNRPGTFQASVYNLRLEGQR